MSKTLEVRGLNKVYQGPGRSVEALDEAVYLGQRVLVLSSSPAVVQEDLAVDLPDERDQLTTRSDPRFTQLRSHVHAQIQQAKRGGHPGQLTAGR